MGRKSILIFSLLALSGCSPKVTQTGLASYYGDQFSGRKTASGATFSQGKRTAAHKTLPFGTKVQVRNMRNGKAVRVVINDRGPFVQGRVIDLSKKAAKKIQMTQDGVVEVRLRYKKPDNAH